MATEMMHMVSLKKITILLGMTNMFQALSNVNKLGIKVNKSSKFNDPPGPMHAA